MIYSHKRILGISIYQFFALLFVGTLIMFFPILLSQFSSYFSLDNPQSAYIGDSIGGMTAPFFSLLSCILVYAAFKAQIKANQLIQDQFKQQNNDDLFFRLIDSIHNRISMFSLHENNKEISGQEVLDALNRQIKINYIKPVKQLGINHMINFPEDVEDNAYRELHRANEGYHALTSDIEPFKNSFISRLPIDDGEVISRKSFIESYQDYSDFHKCLIKIGRDKLYTIPFEERLKIYQWVFTIEYEKHRGFFDGYFNSFNYLLSFINKNNSDSFYISFLKENITSIEKILIFYYCTSSKCDFRIKNLINSFDILGGLEKETNLFFTKADSKILLDDIRKVTT